MNDRSIVSGRAHVRDEMRTRESKAMYSILRPNLRFGATGLAIVLLGLTGGSVQAQVSKDLTIVSWGGSYTRSQMLAYVKPFRNRIGEWVEMRTYGGGLDEIREQVETENVTWDVVDFEQSDLIRGCREGLLETIDHAALEAGSDGTAPAEDFIPGALTECGVGQMVWSTVVAYDGSRIEGDRPAALADFFDLSKYPGKRGLRRDPRVAMEWALMADGVAPADVYATLETEDGQMRAFSVLDQIRTNIVWWTTGSQPVELLDSGAVVMTSAWNGRLYRPIVEDGKDYAIIWDGQLWDIDSWGIPKGSANRSKAMTYIAFATSSARLADQTKHISYGPARRSAMALVADDTKAMLPTAEANMATALQMDAGWWASRHGDLAGKFEKWLASGGRGPSGTAR